MFIFFVLNFGFGSSNLVDKNNCSKLFLTVNKSIDEKGEIVYEANVSGNNGTYKCYFYGPDHKILNKADNEYEISGLSSGVYYCYVIDNLGCNQEVKFEVE